MHTALLSFVELPASDLDYSWDIFSSILQLLATDCAIGSGLTLNDLGKVNRL